MAHPDVARAVRELFIVRGALPRYGRLAGLAPSWLIGRGPESVPAEERERLVGLLPPQSAVIVTDSERV